MSNYGKATLVAGSFEDTLTEVRAALAAEGFGVLTEIDVRATMKAKLGIDVPSQVILGACNPLLAHGALEIEPSIGLLLPCNVVVRDTADGTLVEAIDPAILVGFTGNEGLEPVAREAGRGLAAALGALGQGVIA